MCRPKGTRAKDRCDKHAAGPDRSASDRSRRHAQKAVATRKETAAYAQAAYGKANGAPLRRGSMWRDEPSAPTPTSDSPTLRRGSMWRGMPGSPPTPGPVNRPSPTEPARPDPPTAPGAPLPQEQPDPPEEPPVNGRKALSQMVAPHLSVEDLAVRLEHDDYGRRKTGPYGYSNKLLEELAREHPVTEVVRPPHWRPPIPGQKAPKDKTVTRPASLAELPREARQRYMEARKADAAYGEYKKNHAAASRADTIEQQLLAQHGVEKLTDLDDSQLGEWMTARAEPVDNTVQIPAEHAVLLKAANDYRAERAAKKLRRKVRKTVNPKDRKVDPELLKELGVVNPLRPGESVRDASKRIFAEHRNFTAMQKEHSSALSRLEAFRKAFMKATGWKKDPDPLVYRAEYPKWRRLEGDYRQARARLERHTAQVRAISALTGRPFADIR